MNATDIRDGELTSFPMPVASQDTAAEELLVLSDWAAEQLPSLDELLELRCYSL